MSPEQRQQLVAAVQTNCHIADARHAADMPLCIYLLQMRELHRWERGVALGESLVRSEVGSWFAERETLWSSLEGRDFMPLPLGDGDQELDPFDVDAIDRRLRPLGLLYGAGLAGPQRPLFFIAELQEQNWRDGLPVLMAGRELARSLQAPPAALGRYGTQETIVIRRESLARWCWEKFEAYTTHRNAGTPLHAVVQSYGQGDDFAAALPQWLDDATELMVLHELGEHQAGRQLGPDWGAMRLSLRTRRSDLYVRALRDHLADLTLTLPTLLERGADTSLHIWFANYEGVRETLYPTLTDSYAAWRQGDGGHALRRAVAVGHAHFTRLAQQVLALHASEAEAAPVAIQSLLTSPGAICHGS